MDRERGGVTDSGGDSVLTDAGPRLLVVNQYFRPDVASTGQYATGICDGLGGRGFDVEVVAAEPCYTPDAPRAPRTEVFESGVRVHRVPMGGTRGRENPLSRFAGYGRFMVQAWRRAREVADARPPDLVLTFHNPPFVGMIGARLADRYGVPFVYSPFDMLPESVRLAGWSLPEVAFEAWHGVNRRIHGRADRIVVLGDSMAEHLADKLPDPSKVEAIHLWARPELDGVEPSRELRRELGVGEEELLVLWAGNMGYQHALAPILDAAARLREEPVRFLFLGRGPEREPARASADDRGLDNVRFLDYQPEERFRRILASSDVGLVALKEGMERLCFPSRALTFLSAGLPVLAVTAPEADLARVIRERGCGWVASDDEECRRLLARLIRDGEEVTRRGERASEVYRDSFGRGETVDGYESIFEGCLDGRDSSETVVASGPAESVA